MQAEKKDLDRKLKKAQYRLELASEVLNDLSGPASRLDQQFQEAFRELEEQSRQEQEKERTNTRNRTHAGGRKK